MSGFPWFKFYSAEWLGLDEHRRLTAEQRGCLINLLAECWLWRVRGVLPDDDSLWHRAGASSKKRWERIKGPVLEHFTQSKGMLISISLKAQAANAKSLHEDRSEAGKKGAEAKKQKDRTLSRGNCQSRERREKKEKEKEPARVAISASVRKLTKAKATPPVERDEAWKSARRQELREQAESLLAKERPEDGPKQEQKPPVEEASA